MTKKIYKMRYISKTNSFGELERRIQLAFLDGDQCYDDNGIFEYIDPIWESRRLSCKKGSDYDFLLEWYRVSCIVMQCNNIKTSDTTLLYLLNN